MSFTLPKEKAWLGKKDLFESHPIAKSIYQDENRFKVIVAGRRFGKSVVAMAEVIRIAMTVPYAVCWIVGPDYSTINDVYLENLLLRLTSMGVPYNHDKRSNKITILKNSKGTTATIVFKSAQYESTLKGRSLDIIVFDEFAMIDPKIWVGVLPSILENESAKVIVISSVRMGGIGNALLKNLAKKGDENSLDYCKGWKSWKQNSLENPLLTEENLRLIKAGLSDEQLKQEIYSEFVESSGGVYSCYDSTVHVRPLELNRNVALNLSFDFNVKLQTTTISQILDGRTELYKYNNKEIKEQYRVLNILDCINTKGDVVLIQRQCDEIKKYLQNINWTGDLYIYGDASGKAHHGDSSDGNSYWETIRVNFPNAGYYLPKSNPPVLSRFNCVNTLFKNGNGEIGLFINSNDGCKPLIRDFEEICYNLAGTDQDKSNLELTHNADNIGYLIAREFPIKSKYIKLFYS